VQTKDAIVVLVDHDGPSYLAALSKADGKTLWKTDRTSRVSWSSPSLVRVGEREQIVTSSSGTIDGYDAEGGKALWTFDDVRGNTTVTPCDIGGRRFLIGASAGREAEGARAGQARKSNMAMQIDLVDGKPEPKVLWRNEQASPSFGSPMVHAGHAYWINRAGVVYCLHEATGESKYTQRTKQSCWATPLGVGDRVYFFGKDGITTVLAAGPEFKVLAENQLWNPDDFKPDPNAGKNEGTEQERASAAMFSGPVQYGIAAIDGSLLIRTGDRLYCVRQANDK
jgi:outer membrane protein assembly factor BamB